MGTRELQSLLREIRNVRSPIQRMKLISLAWRTVQRLSVAEKKQLATELGGRGFGAILEKLGVRKEEGGIAPAEVLQALEAAKDLDVSELNELLHQLRSPEQREEILEQGLELLEETLEPEEEPAQEIPEGEPDADDRQIEELQPPPAPEDAPRPADVGQAGSTPDASDDDSEKTEVPEPPPPVEPPRPVLPVVVPFVPATDTDPLAYAAIAEVSYDRATRLEAVPSLITRFRLLRETLDAEDDLDTTRIRSMIASFPEGWARRRAVASILRDGLPEALDDALSLIDDLDRASDRRWACSALIDSRELSEEDAERIAERFPFPSIARRLRRNAGTADGYQIVST